MIKLSLFALCLLGLAFPCAAQATLDLDGTNGLATVTVTAGQNFTLDIDYTSTLATPALAAFNVTLSGSPLQVSAIPQGLTFDSFSGLVANFAGAASNTDPLIFSAAANSAAADISSTSPTTLLDANFTANTSGTYTIAFAPDGNGATDDQGLFSNGGTAITYVASGASVTVAPEPHGLGLLGLGLLGLLGVGAFRRRVLA